MYYKKKAREGNLYKRSARILPYFKVMLGITFSLAEKRCEINI